MIVPRLSHQALLADIGAARKEQSGLNLWWLGQSGFLVHWQDRQLLIDPYLSDSLTEKYAKTDKPHERMTELVIDPAGSFISPGTAVESRANVAPLLARSVVDEQEGDFGFGKRHIETQSRIRLPNRTHSRHGGYVLAAKCEGTDNPSPLFIGSVHGEQAAAELPSVAGIVPAVGGQCRTEHQS